MWGAEHKIPYDVRYYSISMDIQGDTSPSFDHETAQKETGTPTLLL